MSLVDVHKQAIYNLLLYRCAVAHGPRKKSIQDTIDQGCALPMGMHIDKTYNQETMKIPYLISCKIMVLVIHRQINQASPPKHIKHILIYKIKKSNNVGKTDQMSALNSDHAQNLELR